MRTIYKKYILFFNTIVSIIRILRDTSFKNALKKDPTIQNSACYILGNSPSLDSSIIKNIDLLKNNIVISVNEFALTKYYELLKPKYYILVDPVYWLEEKKLTPVMFNMREQLYNRIESLTDWKIKIYIPTIGYKLGLVSDRFLNKKNIEVCGINTTFIEGSNSFKNYCYKKNWGVLHFQNVLGVAIYLAIVVGYKEINLFGAEHSWTEHIKVNDQNEVCITGCHFYDKDVSILEPWRKVDGEVFKMHEILISLANMFSAHTELRRFADCQKVDIYNRTPNSFIDSYERRY